MASGRRRLRWILGTALGVVAVAVGAASALVLPRVGALRFLLGMTRPVPEAGALPPRVVTLGGGADGPRRVRVFPGPRGPRPAVVVVHGVTAEGIDDPRLVRLASALEEAGFAAVCPEVAGLVRIEDGDRDGERLGALLRAVAAGRLPGVQAGRFGVFGISVGGPLALEASAGFAAEGGRGLRALALVGAPADLRRCAAGWFAEPAPSGDGAPAADRARAAEFGRNTVFRAAALAAVPDADRATVRRWLEEAWSPAARPEGLVTAEGRAFADLVLAGPGLPGGDRDRVLDAAWRSLGALAAATPGEALAALSGTPVFLLHGVEDPLVPVAEMPLLAERLRAHTTVRTLRSLLLTHTDVGESDRWDHLLFLDAFFDAIED